MAKAPKWKSIVASALDWDQGHATFDAAVRGVTKAKRGRKVRNFPHTVWQLVEHIRITQHDLVDFCTNPNYSHDLKWPEGYWPETQAPPSDAAWTKSIAQIRKDTRALARFATTSTRDLTSKIPHGTGQTYLRTIILAVDHTSYHVGQIVAVRQLLSDWK